MRRDELAVLLMLGGRETSATINDYKPAYMERWLLAADRFLSSDWLAQHDREVAAGAWDEGWRAGCGDELVGRHTFNPHSDPEPVPETADQVWHTCPRGPE